MALAEPSLSLDHQRPVSSPRPPRTLSPISKRPLLNSFQRPFMDPPLQALPSIEAPSQKQVVFKPESQSSPTTQVVGEYLPMELLQTLKRQSNNSLSPGGGKPTHRHPPLPKSGASASTAGVSTITKAPPANLWNYSGRRGRLKHLTEAPPCICGAGKDISFLYDVELSRNNTKETAGGGTSVQLPNTLIPEEYHVVKSPGVLGLEFHDDPYVTRSEDHDHHMTVFPSMRPAGRHEVVTLKHTLETMLKRAGVPNEFTDSDLNGPTVMHNLLELLQKEQTIYNICFHEVIRQVSVHCMERGELLADIRRRYNNLLDRIPRQVKCLHDELVAQRTLDKKLSTELKRFKGRISNLTDELSLVKEHDLHVTEQSRMAEHNLSSALADSEKNSNLLAEYHSLYELQRNRLENQTTNLTFERDLWLQASYNLAQRVAQEASLQTLQRVQLCEKAWVKLAGHFAVILSDKDTQQLSEIQEYVQRWREGVLMATDGMLNMEARMRERLAKVECGMQRWIDVFDKLLNAKEGSSGPSRSQIEHLFSDIKLWEDIVNEEAENFSGDALVNRQEELTRLQDLTEQWTDVAVKLFTRHQEEGAVQSPEQTRMVTLNTAVDEGLKMYTKRLSGENGVATGFIHIVTPLESWDTKLGLILSSHDKSLSLSDWTKFCTQLKEWLTQIHYIISCIGTDHQSRSEVSKEDSKEEMMAPMSGLLNEAEKWRAALSHAIDSNDTLITTKVRRLHSLLVKWMVELLLKLTNTSVQREEDFGHKQHIVSTADLMSDYTTLAESMTAFTKMLIRRCVDVVRDIVDQRIQEDYPNPEEEQVELKRLNDEMSDWVRLAGLLVGDTDQPDSQSEVEKEKDKNVEEKESPEPRAESAVEGAADVLPETMSVVGVDDNIHSKSLQQVIEETEAPPLATSADLGLPTEDLMPEGRDPRREDMEALLVNLDETNKKLQEQEELTKNVEERAQTAERDLEVANARIAALEVDLQSAKTALESHSKTSGRGSRSGPRASISKKQTGRSNSQTPGASRPTSRK